MGIHDRIRKKALDDIAEIIRLAIEGERERCAQVAATVDLFDGDMLKNSDPRITIAAAIRSPTPPS
jgi:hypothetical protein